MRLSKLLAPPLALVATLVALSACAEEATAVSCDKVAAPHGSDRAHGTVSDPYRTVDRMVRSLDAGEVGCLRSGRYPGDVTISHGGRPGKPLTLASYPGARATVAGRITVTREAHDVVVRDLFLDGRNRQRLPSPTVNGTRVTFVGNDVTNANTAICFILGNPVFGRANGTTLRRNRVHHCGRLPATNHDHGIYVSWASDTAIVDNWIYDNADRGIQLYTDAQRTRISGNVIDGNGVGIIFSGDGGRASNDTLVTRNVIANSRVRANLEAYWPPGNPVGRGNLVRGNCLFGGNPNVDLRAGGFVSRSNLVAAPLYVNRTGADLRLRGSSGCASVLATAASDGDARVPGPPKPR